MSELEDKSSKEDEPLQSTSPSSSDDHETKTKGFLSGVFLNKTKLIILAVAFLVLLIIIIILAALLGKANSRRKEMEDKHGNGKAKPHATPSGPVPTTPGTEAWWRVRLPDNVIPIHYNLLMNITVDQPRFDGKVEIIVNVTSPTSLVLVHIDKLNVSNVAVLTSQGEQVQQAIKRQFGFKKNQFYVIELKSNLNKGMYSVKMDFEGFFSADLRSLYRSTFKNADGKRIYFAATQFEPVRARGAFPCFDEPALKATYTVTIAHRPDYIALSNMPIYKSETVNGQKLDYFSKSVKMSTYLVAFVVGDFDHEEITTKDNVKMRIYSRPAAIDQTAFAASIGSKVITFFGEYYNVKYPLPKMDMIGLPDFGPGAMENWGLITYRERYLMWNRRQSEGAKASVASIITHEIAHQWFGNIATMRWWDDLWLNEAFATLMPYVALAAVEPTWEVDHFFTMKETTRAMNLDGLTTSHPIKVPVNSPDEIGEIFDTISYAKGACVLRMLDFILGNKTFANGLTIYLKKHAYRNAETVDLWKAMKEASCAAGRCVDVKNIMDTWTLQMGFPVVNIKKTDPDTYTVTQKHFLYDPKANVSSSKYKSPFGYKWVIPFTYITSKQRHLEHQWMYKNSTTIKWDGSTWIKGNYGSKGYYLVNYEDSNWKELAKQLNTDHNIFDVDDRTGLIFDAFNLAKGSLLNYTIAFSITEYLGKEVEYSPWRAIKTMTSYIQLVLPESSPALANLQKYLVHQGQTLYNKFGFKDTGSRMEIYKRRLLLDIFCGAGVASCVDNATAMFKKWMENPNSYTVPPNLRSFVYTQGIAAGGEKEWDFLYDQYTKSNSAADQRIMISALGASKESWILSRYLKYSMDPLKFRKSLNLYIFEAAAHGSSSARRLTWDFVRMNWEVLVNKIYGSARRAYSATASRIAKGFSTNFDLDELVEFNAKVKASSGFESKSQTQAVDTVKSNINWVQANKKTVENWLADFIKRNNI